MRSNYRPAPLRIALLLALAAGPLGCVAVAAGAGAATAVHLKDNGVESLIDADVAKTETAARKTFTDLGINETKARTETGSGTDKRIIDGNGNDRDVTVTISADGNRSKVEVVARKSAVTWDKDYAKTILEKMISNAG